MLYPKENCDAPPIFLIYFGRVGGGLVRARQDEQHFTNRKKDLSKTHKTLCACNN